MRGRGGNGGVGGAGGTGQPGGGGGPGGGHQGASAAGNGGAWRVRFLGLVILAAVGCGGARRMPPSGTADQTLRDAVVLVCDAPARAASETGMSKSDAIAMHLTDGIGNDRVLTTVEAWKTNGIVVAELDALIKEANVRSCPLRETAGAN